MVTLTSKACIVFSYQKEPQRRARCPECLFLICMYPHWEQGCCPHLTAEPLLQRMVRVFFELEIFQVVPLTLCTRIDGSVNTTDR